MLRSIIVCPDKSLAESFLSAIGELEGIRNLTVFHSYPEPQRILRSVRALAADVVFLSFEDPNKAAEIVALLEIEARHVEVAAIHQTVDSEVLRQTMRAGIREFFGAPFDRPAMVDALIRIGDLIVRRPRAKLRTTDVFSFLPAKAGAGTSTVALNTAAAMSRAEEASEETKRRVLLADFDLSAGMLRFLLKLTNSYSSVDAMENALKMDENLWKDLVTPVANMDVLHSGTANPNYRVDPDHIRELAAFVGRCYGVVCFDLSGNLERYSLELMSESKRILMVCTPEVPCMHQAREKLAYLKTVDLAARVSVVMNRFDRRALFTTAQVEEMLGVPVIASLPNDYSGVNQAATEGSWVRPTSDLGIAFTALAATVRGRPVAPSPFTKHKFLEIVASVRRTPIRAE